MFAAAAISSLVAIVPWVGGILSLGVLIYLVARFTGMEMWPSGALLVLIAWGLGYVGSAGLLMYVE